MKIVGVIARVTGKVAYHVGEILHRVLDEVLAHCLYNLFRGIGKSLYCLESYLYEYLKKSKYVDDDKFEQKIEEDKVIALGMGLSDTRKITLREISYELNVSEHYARKIKEIAKNWHDYYWQFKEIMKNRKSDSEKKDKRSEIRAK